MYYLKTPYQKSESELIRVPGPIPAVGTQVSFEDLGGYFKVISVRYLYKNYRGVTGEEFIYNPEPYIVVEVS
jgi:hypothetical protein